MFQLGESIAHCSVLWCIVYQQILVVRLYILILFGFYMNVHLPIFLCVVVCKLGHVVSFKFLSLYQVSMFPFRSYMNVLIPIVLVVG